MRSNRTDQANPEANQLPPLEAHALRERHLTGTEKSTLYCFLNQLVGKADIAEAFTKIAELRAENERLHKRAIGCVTCTERAERAEAENERLTRERDEALAGERQYRECWDASAAEVERLTLLHAAEVANVHELRAEVADMEQRIHNDFERAVELRAENERLAVDLRNARQMFDAAQGVRYGENQRSEEIITHLKEARQAFYERAERAEAEVAATRERAEASLDEIHRQRDEWQEQAEKLHAEVARMRPYVEACVQMSSWNRWHPESGELTFKWEVAADMAEALGHIERGLRDGDLTPDQAAAEYRKVGV